MPPTTGLISFQLPLPWLISVTVGALLFMVSVGWNASTQSSKLDQLIAANAKLEKRLDDRDTKLDMLKDSIYAVQRAEDVNNLRITALEGKIK